MILILNILSDNVLGHHGVKEFFGFRSFACLDYWHLPCGKAVASYAKAQTKASEEGWSSPPVRAELVSWFQQLSLLFCFSIMFSFAKFKTFQNISEPNVFC